MLHEERPLRIFENSADIEYTEDHRYIHHSPQPYPK